LRGRRRTAKYPTISDFTLNKVGRDFTIARNESIVGWHFIATSACPVLFSTRKGKFNIIRTSVPTYDYKLDCDVRSRVLTIECSPPRWTRNYKLPNKSNGGLRSLICSKNIYLYSRPKDVSKKYYK
jgi:hypothetical protein